MTIDNGKNVILLNLTGDCCEIPRLPEDLSFCLFKNCKQIAEIKAEIIKECKGFFWLCIEVGNIDKGWHTWQLKHNQEELANGNAYSN